MTQPPLTASVAICTWNRARLLASTLEQMTRLRVPEDVTWEVLVVDNNSTDDTAQVLESFRDRLPLVALFEPEQGHSAARNRAVSSARGELIVWTDDDVDVEPDWLAEMVAAARRHPEASFFAGRIAPRWEVVPPPWMIQHLEQLQGPFALADHGPEVRRLADDESPVGANMAFRLEALQATPFSTRLGRKGNQLTSADDKDVCYRLRQEGHTGVWVGTATVHHFIPRERTSTEYLTRWFRGGGQTMVRQDRIAPAPLLAGVPRWIWGQYLRARMRAWLGRWSDQDKWFESFRQAAVLEGVIHELRANR